MSFHLTSKNLQDWLEVKAVSLWSQSGFDAATHTVWEALDHAGNPLQHMPKRLRVQARQAWSFARVGHTARAWTLFRFCMDKGFQSPNGNLACLFSPDVAHCETNHDLYDLSFVLLAAAALTEAGFDTRHDLAFLKASLARLKADRGWHETITTRPVRRQNPHMHLFEASVALIEVTDDMSWRGVADECFDLFLNVFLQRSGRVYEYFDFHWKPLKGSAQSVEPGHMAEWIHLLARYEQVTGENTFEPRARLAQMVRSFLLPCKLLPNREGDTSDLMRLWPQTELLRAAVTLCDEGDRRILPEDVFEKIWTIYLKNCPQGGWFDEVDQNQIVQSDFMPSSSFYHIVGAFDALALHLERDSWGYADCFRRQNFSDYRLNKLTERC